MTSEQAMHPTAPEISVKGLPERPDVTEAELRAGADALTAQWQMLGPASGDSSKSGGLTERLKHLSVRLKERLAAAKLRATTKELTPELELLESTRMLEAAIISADAAKATFAKLPLIHLATGEDLPRVMNLAEGYVAAAKGIWSAESLAVYVGQAQMPDPLLLEEVRVIPQALKVAELEYILDQADAAFALAEMPPIEESPFSAALHSLRRLNQFEWRDLLESLIVFDSILRQDPTGVFARMEAETRSAYHIRIADLAKNGDLTEVGTAQMALEMARKGALEAESDPRRGAALLAYRVLPVCRGVEEAEGEDQLQPADVRAAAGCAAAVE